MIGAKSQDGKISGNSQLVASHDSAHAKPQGEAGGGDIGAFVQQHGPAEQIHIQHDHAAGQHHVTSHHKGKKHHSTHGSAEEAHAHAAQAAGISQGEPDGDEMGDADMGSAGTSKHSGQSAGYL